MDAAGGTDGGCCWQQSAARCQASFGVTDLSTVALLSPEILTATCLASHFCVIVREFTPGRRPERRGGLCKLEVVPCCAIRFDCVLWKLSSSRSNASAANRCFGPRRG